MPFILCRLNVKTWLKVKSKSICLENYFCMRELTHFKGKTSWTDFQTKRFKIEVCLFYYIFITLPCTVCPTDFNFKRKLTLWKLWIRYERTFHIFPITCVSANLLVEEETLANKNSTQICSYLITLKKQVNKFWQLE